MMKIENECVNCGLPCLGSSCPNRQVKHFYCDKCGEEETLYCLDGQELCATCVLEALDIVEGSEW